MNISKKLYITITSLLLFGIFSYAQTTKIIGQVIDKQTKEPIPFVNISLKGIQVGTISDFNGNFKLETKLRTDSIIFSYIGYRQVAKKLNRNQFQKLEIEMVPSSLELNEVVVEASKRDKNNDPAINLFKNIIDHKPQNNIDKLESYQYEVYNKVQFDINNITDKFKNQKILKPFQFIFDYVDTSVVNGKPYLPIFLIESLSDYYYRKNPFTEREIIKATQVSGINNESIQEFLGNMYVNVNVYDNYIDIFGKGFISPISNTGRVFYKYFLVDSASMDGHWCYHMVFQPRMKQEYVFNGDFWVADTSFAIKKINLRVDRLVNINFINNLDISQEFNEIEDTTWMITKDIFIADFNMVVNPIDVQGFFGRKTTTYKNHVINQDPDERFFDKVSNIIVENDADEKDQKFWDEARHEALTVKEQQIYNMVDTIKKLPAFRTYYDIISTAITGYYVWGNFEIGPYFTTYSTNPLEGNRFRLGGRTSNQFSTKFMPEIYLAYGTKDEKFKYGGSFIYLLNKNPRRGFGGSYKYDVEQLGQSSNAFREDNIMSSILRRSPKDKLSLVEEFQCHYEHEWFPGFANNLTLCRREVFPVAQIGNFEIQSGDELRIKNSLITSEISLHTRFAFNEKFVMGEFERISLGTNYPIIDVNFTFGLKGVIDSEFEYRKIEINVKDWFNLYPFGYSKYILNGGKIWGNIPYPLLKIHEGNETYGFDKYSFNMMNYYEFVSDLYISLYYSHYFEGFFFNKVPLFKKLKWREVVWGKAVIGTTRRENVGIMEFLENMHTFDNPNRLDKLKPYTEAGIGIENIFKFIRVDAIWRLAYLKHENVTPFGVRISLHFKF